MQRVPRTALSNHRAPTEQAAIIDTFFLVPQPIPASIAVRLVVETFHRWAALWIIPLPTQDSTIHLFIP